MWIPVFPLIPWLIFSLSFPGVFTVEHLRVPQRFEAQVDDRLHRRPGLRRHVPLGQEDEARRAAEEQQQTVGRLEADLGDASRREELLALVQKRGDVADRGAGDALHPQPRPRVAAELAQRHLSVEYVGGELADRHRGAAAEVLRHPHRHPAEREGGLREQLQRLAQAPRDR
eukprot:gene4425-biopygen12160